MATYPGRKKGLGKEYRGIAALAAGPGGWHCPCCNPYNQETKSMKAKAHRVVRRKAKQNLPKDKE